MSTTSYKSSVKAIYLLGLFCVLSMTVKNGNAFEFKVGGSTGKWQVPSDPNAAVYNQWAEKNRFQVGDTLLFVYSPDQDSVLQVTKEDYENCKTSSPLQKFTNGHTVYKFNQSGPHYFISGESDHCQKNEKMIVVVMAQRNNKNIGTQPPSSSPPPSSSEANVPPPSPAPAGEEPPSPPPSDVETNPAPAPSEESSPDNNNADNNKDKNGGFKIVSGGVGILAAFVASSLVLAI